MKTESLSRAVAAVALAVVCAVVWASEASAQRTIACQRADGTWYPGECRPSGGSGPIYVPPPPPSPRQLADQAASEGDSHFAKDLEKAIAAYRRALSHMPDDPAIQRKLRHAQAEIPYRAHKKLAQERLRKPGSLANIRANLPKEIALLRDAIRIDPDHAPYREALRTMLAYDAYLRGVQHEMNNDFDAAARAFREAWQHYPSENYKKHILDAEARGRAHKAKAANARGNELWKKGDHAGAIAAYEAALKHDPNAEYARKNLRDVKVAKAEDKGRAFLKDKNYDAAIKAFEEALRHDPNSDSAKNNLLRAKAARESSKAESYYVAKDYDSAIAKYEDALRQNPKSSYVRDQLQQARAMKSYEHGRLFLAARDYDAALRSFEEAAKHRPQDGALADNIRKVKVARELHEGEALLRRGERKLALEAFKRALVLDPNDPRAAAKLEEAESVRGAVSGQIAAVRHQVRSAVSAVAGRAGQTFEEARAAAELSGNPGAALVFDTVAKWTRSAGSWGPSGDGGVVAVPAKTWSPAPPERETRPMAALRGRIEHLEQEAKQAAAERATETDLVKKAALKEKEFKAEYNAKILKDQYEKEYKTYAPLTAPPGDDVPDAAPEPSAQGGAPAGPVATGITSAPRTAPAGPVATSRQ
jgi:tetratricopeptide (TPR) repeat protein